MAMHVFDLALCNSWIEYRKHADILKIPEKDIMDSMDFRMDNIAESLLHLQTRLVEKKDVNQQSEQVPEQSNTK